MVETLLEFLTAWGTTCEDSGFIAAFDADGDCLIGASDLLAMLADFASGATDDGGENISRIKK